MKVILCVILLTISSTLVGQVREELNYYPLHVGDVRYLGITPFITYEKVKLGYFEYYKVSNLNSETLERIDSSGNVFVKRDNYPEQLYLSLSAKLGEKVTTYLYNWELTVTLESINDTVVTQDTTFINCRRYSFYFKTTADGNYQIWLAPNVGLVKRYSLDWGTSSSLLKSIINGKRIPNKNLDLTIKSTTPTNLLKNVPIDAPIKIEPKYLIKSDFINYNNFTVESKKRGKIEFEFKGDYSKSYSYITLIPKNNFEFEDEITVTINKNVTDHIGDKLDSDYSFKFSTESFRANDNLFVKSTNGPYTTTSWGDFDVFDFDNDGNKDIVLSGQQSNPISRIVEIYRNNGYIFHLVDSFPGLINGDYRKDNCKFVDFDNDGDVDVSLSGYVSVGNQAQYKVMFLINQGNRFGVGPSLDLWAQNLKWYDYDNNGTLDLLVWEYQSSSAISLYENNKGNLSKISSLNSQPSSGLLELYDLDNDGQKEIIKTGGYTIGATLIAKINNRAIEKLDISFPHYFYEPLHYGMDCADIDNDGDKDLIIGSILLQRDGNKFLLKEKSIEELKDSFPKFYDYNNDGFVDLFLLGTKMDVVNRERTFVQLYRNDKGNFKLFDELNFGYNAYPTAAKWDDINKDGSIDLLAMSSNGFIKMHGKPFLSTILINSSLPLSITLSQNFPNPFNPSTTIEYTLPKSEHVTLKVFDVLGREVATLVDEFKLAGAYSTKLNTQNYKMSSGIYFYSLRAGSYMDTKKMIIIK